MSITRVVTCLTVVALLAVTGCGRAPAPATEQSKRTASATSTGHYDPKRDPAADLAAAVREATQSRKRILLVVGGEWCSWCHILDDYLKTETDLDRRWRERYVTVFINFSPENENKSFLANYPKIAGYPHIFVLETTGALLHSQDTALLEEGQSYSKLKMSEFVDRWRRPGS